MVGLKVKVNTQRSDGEIANNETVNILKDIRKLLESGNKSQDIQNKKQESGLLGGLLGGGAKGIAGVLASLGVLSSASNLSNKNSGLENFFTQLTGQQGGLSTPFISNNLYEKTNIDGEDKVLEIDEKTGEILNVLSLREARQFGILDSENKLISKLETQNSIFDKITKSLESNRDAKFITEENSGKITAETERELKLQQEINELLDKKRKQLARQTGSSFKEIAVSAPYTPSTAFEISAQESIQRESTAYQRVNQAFYENSTFNKVFVDLNSITREG